MDRSTPRRLALLPGALALSGALATFLATRLPASDGAALYAALLVAAMSLAGVAATVGLVAVAYFRGSPASAAGADDGSLEAALRARATRAESLLATLPDAVLALDSDGVIVSCNPAAEHLFRTNSELILGVPIERLVPDCAISRIMPAIGSGQFSFDATTRRARLQGLGARRGTRFPAEINIGQSELDPGTIVCIVRDSSEQRRADEELRLYKRAIASSSNGIVISDVTLPDQPVLYVNPAFERMTGYDLADAFGRNCRFLQGADTDAGTVHKMRAAVERGSDCQVTVKNYTKDGSPFWNHITLAPVRDRSGKVTHYIGIQTDVTETKYIEAALEERRAQLDAIFNLSPDGFAAFDRHHRVTYVNAAFLRVTGLEQEDLQHASIERLDALLERVRDPAQAWRPLAAALAEVGERAATATGALNGAARYQDEIHLRNPATRILQRSVCKASGPTEFVLYLRDVTRETEVDRMKSEFLSSAAHELRTPMASIFGFAELLLRRKYPEDRQKEMLATIHRQAKHLTNLVNELLDLARIEARAGKDLTLVEQPLGPLVEETVASLLMPNDPRKVEMDLPQAMPHARIDSGKMRQALLNILSNAYKYSPGGGPIRLTIEDRESGDRSFIGIRVRDSGIGMTPEQLAHASERFYRADTSGNIPGTGLGLSLVKEIMELQGGSLDIASEYGKGTTVTLWLPISAREARVMAGVTP